LPIDQPKSGLRVAKHIPGMGIAVDQAVGSSAYLRGKTLKALQQPLRAADSGRKRYAARPIEQILQRGERHDGCRRNAIQKAWDPRGFVDRGASPSLMNLRRSFTQPGVPIDADRNRIIAHCS